MARRESSLRRRLATRHAVSMLLMRFGKEKRHDVSTLLTRARSDETRSLSAEDDCNETAHKLALQRERRDETRFGKEKRRALEEGRDALWTREETRGMRHACLVATRACAVRRVVGTDGAALQASSSRRARPSSRRFPFLEERARWFRRASLHLAAGSRRARTRECAFDCRQRVVDSVRTLPLPLSPSFPSLPLSLPLDPPFPAAGPLSRHGSALHRVGRIRGESDGIRLSQGPQWRGLLPGCAGGGSSGRLFVWEREREGLGGERVCVCVCMFGWVRGCARACLCAHAARSYDT
jgi:hypothetical protein